MSLKSEIKQAEDTRKIETDAIVAKVLDVLLPLVEAKIAEALAAKPKAKKGE